MKFYEYERFMCQTFKYILFSRSGSADPMASENIPYTMPYHPCIRVPK